MSSHFFDYFRQRIAIRLGRKPLTQKGSPKRNPESKAAFKSKQKPATLEFARIAISQVFPNLIAVLFQAPYSIPFDSH
jgi:hypothetical protein